uniref:Phospholipase A2 group III n=1 Tax=Anolis carolinensis TaxID=28377 RepID=A0A803T0H6_ANOCA
SIHPCPLWVFQGPDVCCREHDHCEAQIPALGYRYGKRNLRLHTISHCDCDSRCKEYGPVPLAHLVQQSHYQPPVPTTQQPSLATRPSPHGRRRGKGRKRRPHLEPASASAPALTPAHSQAHWHQPSPAATASGLAPRLAQSCSCYRRLDQCPYWIGPHEIKYQLHNMDSRTLFHCNCTRR